MKILVIHNTLWAHYKSVLFQEIYRQLPKYHDFHVLQIAKSEKGRAKMTGQNQPEYDYPYTLLFDNYIEDVPKVKEIFHVLKFIIKYNPDVVNVTGYSTSASTLPAILFSKILGKKVVMSSESTQLDKSRSRLKEFIKKIAIKLCSGFLVFGKSSKDYLLELGAEEEEIFVSKGAVVDNEFIKSRLKSAQSEKLFPEISTNKNFIYVGRIAPEKNLTLLIQAFQNIKGDAQDWGLIIVGNGPDDQKIAHQIQQKPRDIFRYDAVGWTEIPNFLSKADCFVLPSTSEPWGLVINEALVCGLTAIVTDACGCASDLIDGNGIVIPVKSLEKLIEAMTKITQTNYLEEMKDRSIEIIKEFSVKNVAEQYTNKITQLR